jgi:hypothetical protein
MRRAPVIARAGVLSLAFVACEKTFLLDTMEAEVVTGSEYCNWTPTSSSTADRFDLGAGLEIKEAVGVALWVSGSASNAGHLEGVLAVTSDAPDIVEVFSASNGGVALLAHSPGNATLTFTLAGHPGTFAAPIQVTPSETFVNIEEVALPPEGGGNAGGSGAGEVGGGVPIGGDGFGGDGFGGDGPGFGGEGGGL